ncbi:MAG: hypothetical protein JNG83_02940 [Opitutaceae bacterium]|nr:hypothetical protein [Opitutaceae bacterium]
MPASVPPSLAQYTEASVAGDGLRWEGHMADDIAATDGPIPMALLVATPEALCLNSTRGNYRLPRSAVTRLGRGNFYPWFFSAVRIHHDVKGCPRELQFKPSRVKPAAVMAQLRSLGYPVG